MLAIYIKEINSFFGTLIGYIVIGVFLIFSGLVMWVLSSTSVFEFSYANMDSFFFLAPVLFVFLIPAITMRSFAEESQQKTLELLFTKPITDKQIILGKYFANITLVLIALLPTIIYYISIYMLGSPKGNIDSGAIFGSYVGLIFLAGVFVAVGMLSSAITNNQVIAFIMAIVISVVLQWGFFVIGKLPVFWGVWDDFIQKFGIDYHYSSISKGLIDTRDILYFISVIFIFLLITHYVIKKKKY
ncbi:MAG: gliding motility-associated ABC transporter permease subunit GldF [Saprospiraceae bacterium]|nr:gliding motility-associated ABC transporter permease subunit GldF [Saprospiraceae bacterium]